MPRVTRRSLAAAEGKEEKTESQPQSSRSRGRRGAKNVEPEETASVDEPQETPAKTGRRGGRAKETTPKEEAPKGRASSRSATRGKGKGEPEPPEEDVEEETEEKEEKASSKRASRGRGRGRGRGRAAGRSSRGKTEEEEAEDEEMEEEAESAKSVEPPKPSSGSRGRGRAKAAAEEETEEAKEVKEVKTTPRGRSRKTPTKTPESEPTPPSGGRRQSGRRGQTMEDVTPKKTPTPERSRRKTETPSEERKVQDKTDVEPESADKDQEKAVTEEEEKQEEAMETEEPQVEAAKSSETASKEEEEVKEETVSGQKRKHEEEEEEEKGVTDGSSKRARLSDVTPATSATAEVAKEDAKEEPTDFVIINKEDVPAADSKEVVDALPPVKKAEKSEEKEMVQQESKAEEPVSSEEPKEMEVTQSKELPPEEDISPEEEVPVETETTEEAQAMEVQEEKQEEEQTSDSEEAPVQTTPDEAPTQTAAKEMSTPDIPVVVPLTEAELAKQYNPTVRDREDASSTLVEVGSEATSDVMSTTRNLDVSDAVSMDATTSEQTNEESNLSSDSHVTSEKSADPATTPKAVADETSKNSLCDIPLPPQSTDAAPAPVNNFTTPQQPVSEVSLNSIPLPPSSVVTNTENQSSTPSSAPTAINTPITNATQNGNVQSSDPVQSVPLHTSTPAKRPSFASLEGYVPSSTSIEKRKFIINPSFPVELFDTAFCFSVVSYNILADVHMRRNDYSYTEPKYLDQSYRHNLLTQELEYLDGDVVCMQEVNPAYYNDTLLPFMKSKGYQGVFMKRTTEWHDEGEATFVKSSKFEILSHQGLSLRDLAYKEIDSGGLSEEVTRAAKKYLDRADVILLCKLLSKKTGKTLTLCNIHVVWDMPSPDVQCIQVACAIKELVSMAGSDLNPYIICGDFNSEVTSPAYHLAKEGYLSDAHIRSLQALEKMDNTDGSSRSLINHLWRAFQHTSSNLKSAYETAVGKEPALTSFTKVTHAAYDYIFFSASSLYTVGALEVIDQQVLEANGGLPSKTIPSDHVSMKALFRLKD